MNAPARTARDDRRKAILDVARDIFMQEGYAAASMSAIAARVGGSKGTLYNYFPSKESLFAALMEAECEAEAWVTSALESRSETLEGMLRDIGRRFLDFVLSENVQNIHRLVIAESGRFPELGRAFYENGPRRGVDVMARWVASQMDAGRLRPGDPDRMATLFLELCKSGLHQRMLWNVEPAPSEAAKAANVETAVDVFLAAYGAEAGPSSPHSPPFPKTPSRAI
jgi:AcrR family transcriptional regulator